MFCSHILFKKKPASLAGLVSGLNYSHSDYTARYQEVRHQLCMRIIAFIFRYLYRVNLRTS
ncbi:hypothetical protein M976_03077 [Buttiauxella ferragutiae ATCC 51602]|uniref:Uncharacterized protein n=1 Tax=Buttiauxella ferragutiae ATCC 51602 TaxID=1354252 RepID=A0ABX2W625_9ENTR|nr:hypothetical protein D8682_03775 [Buttiauxella sp. 3AFRM03]OAT26357.1 hypothetical protein M976_03077 [Buttiauxella ferragutiae ATCC 51602]